MIADVQMLRRVFGTTRAVDDITFSFDCGQVCGFIGPNGAGKTTTMRILATLDEPTAGDAWIGGHSVTQQPERVRETIGFVPDELPVQRDINVHEYLDFFARAHGMQGARRRDTVEGVEEFAGLTGLRDKWLTALSKGMRQRVSLARALVHDPAVLIMDEPAAGLDPRARVELRELLKILATQGKAILISSHILTELAEICDSAIIIERGRILHAGPLDTVLRDVEEPRTVVRVRALQEPDEICRSCLEMPHVEEAAVVSGKRVDVTVAGADEACADLLQALVGRGVRVVEFQPEGVNLEDVFMKLTRGEVQ